MNELQTANSANHTATAEKSSTRTVSPRASVREDAEVIVLELEIPGAQKDSIQVMLENDELKVTAPRFAATDEGFYTVYQERSFAGYKRSFIISDKIDSTGIQADYNDGVLTLKLPKNVQAQPRRIDVQ